MWDLRDETVCDHPDAFDIDRVKRPCIDPIFSSGIRRCIGKTLAVAEFEENLSALTQRIPQLRLDLAPLITGVSGIRSIDSVLLSRQV
jgi:cytochrome P450